MYFQKSLAHYLISQYGWLQALRHCKTPDSLCYGCQLMQILKNNKHEVWQCHQNGSLTTANGVFLYTKFDHYQSKQSQVGPHTPKTCTNFDDDKVFVFHIFESSNYDLYLLFKIKRVDLSQLCTFSKLKKLDLR